MSVNTVQSVRTILLNLPYVADYEVQPGASAGETAEAKALYAKYKDLLLQKRTLKRRLKRFDEEFAAKHNRQPKKTDKEVMRPHYQKYHEVNFIFLLLAQ